MVKNLRLPSLKDKFSHSEVFTSAEKKVAIAKNKKTGLKPSKKVESKAKKKK